jgi:hypothetical protein
MRTRDLPFSRTGVAFDEPSDRRPFGQNQARDSPASILDRGGGVAARVLVFGRHRMVL